jgi:hypothetical protein
MDDDDFFGTFLDNVVQSSSLSEQPKEKECEADKAFAVPLYKVSTGFLVWQALADAFTCFGGGAGG